MQTSSISWDYPFKASQTVLFYREMTWVTKIRITVLYRNCVCTSYSNSITSKVALYQKKGTKLFTCTVLHNYLNQICLEYFPQCQSCIWNIWKCVLCLEYFLRCQSCIWNIWKCVLCLDYFPQCKSCIWNCWQCARPVFKIFSAVPGLHLKYLKVFYV